jgi:hypothetical protein
MRCFWWVLLLGIAASRNGSLPEKTVRKNSLEKRRSELEPRGTGRIGQRRDAAVIPEVTPVETNLRDSGGPGSLCHRPPDHLGGLAVATEADTVSQFAVAGARGGEGFARGVVDDLHVDVLVGAEDREPGAVGRATNEPPNAMAAPGSLSKNGAGVFHNGRGMPEVIERVMS